MKSSGEPLNVAYCISLCTFRVFQMTSFHHPGQAFCRDVFSNLFIYCSQFIYCPTASEASCGAYQTFTGLWVPQKGAKVSSQVAKSPSLMKIAGQISPTKMRLTTKNHILRQTARTEFFRWHFYFFLNHFI